MKFHFLKYLRTEVACNRRRLLSTAAVRDTPYVSRKPASRVPKSVRKAMVLDFVNKYKALNDGKFPNGRKVMEQVGGSWYTIRPILQELEHNSKLSAVMTADNNSVVGPASHRVDISAVKDTEGVTPLDMMRRDDGYMLSDVKVTSDTSMASQTAEADQISVIREVLDCQVTRTSSTDSGEVLAETSSTSQGGVETAHSQMKLDILSMNKTSSLTEVASQSDTRSIIDLEFKKTSTVGASDKTDLVEKSSSDETVTELASRSDTRSIFDLEFKKTSTVGASDKTHLAEKSSSDETVTEVASRSDTRSIIDLEFKKTSTVGASDKTNLVEKSSSDETVTEVASRSDTRSIIVLEFKKTSTVGASDKTNSVEKSSSDETVKASKLEKSGFCANSSWPSDTLGGGVDTKCGDGNKAFHPASVTDECSRAITREKTQEQEPEGTLWGNLKSMASRVINSWRKT